MLAHGTNEIAIWTDGLGTYQAKCMDCEWVGRWFRDNKKAVEQAKLHGQTHVVALNGVSSTNEQEN